MRDILQTIRPAGDVRQIVIYVLAAAVLVLALIDSVSDGHHSHGSMAAPGHSHEIH